MSFKGTPGPFEMCKDGNKLPHIVGPAQDMAEYGTQEAGTIAKPIIARLCAQSNKTAANALLLAASFDLLCACQSMAAALQGFTGEELPRRAFDIHPVAYDDAHEAIWKAIAKATGEARS